MSSENWNAKWIWYDKKQRAAGENGNYHQLVYFRREFYVPNANCTLKINVSADSRYRLFLNEESVSIGPCKGDGNTWYYETVDLTNKIKEGKNIIAAWVIHYGDYNTSPSGKAGPASVCRTSKGGFLLDGILKDTDSSVLEDLSSGDGWKCMLDSAVSFAQEDFTLYVGGTEIVDGCELPHDWKSINYNDAQWRAATVVSDIMDQNWGSLSDWQLTERIIPQMYERPTDFSNVKAYSKEQWNKAELEEFLCSTKGKDLILPSGSKTFIEVDAGEFTTGYPEITMVGGAGSIVQILCAECYESLSSSSDKRQKFVRDEPNNQKLMGPIDVYKVAGVYEESENRCEIYEPLLSRCFRFIRLEVEVGKEALTIKNFRFREAAYPLEVKGSFECSEPSFSKIWEISKNTLSRCMHETYVDTPYYEHMQYEMDTCLQSIYTYCISGDDRLARKAMEDFHSSLLPCGLLQSRYPAAAHQVIVGFSFYWIHMIYDHYMYFGDKTLIKKYLPAVDAILGWFERHINNEGIVGVLPQKYWHFVDWVPEWDKCYGAPTAKNKGPVTIFSLMYSAALNKAAELCTGLGRIDTALEYNKRATAVNEAVKAACWSEELGLYRDGPEASEYSQHTQLWAILSEAVSGQASYKLMNTMLENKEISKVSYAMSYFLFRAMSKADLYDNAFGYWELWQKQVDMNLTTWVEDPVNQRSDCHGWSAVPLYDFPSEILGVKPSAPGYAGITVQPHPGSLTWAKGKVPTSRGEVLVNWSIDQAGIFSIEVNSPSAIPIKIILPDHSCFEFLGGTNQVQCHM